MLLAGCGRKSPAVAGHLAILRFENVGPDASSDWMGRAFSEILVGQLAGLPDNFVIPTTRLHALDRQLGVRPASAPGISTERASAILAGADRIGYGEYAVRGGKVTARLTIEDPATGRTTEVLAASAPDVISAAAILARAISPRAAAYETHSPEALRHYIAATESGDPRQRVTEAQAAIAADPDFGPPYRALAEAKAQMQDRDGALAALDEGLARAAVPAREHALLEMMAAGLRNDSAAREHALIDLANASPGDAENWRSLGELAYARHDYKQAVEAYRKVLQLQPNEMSAVNQLAYSQGSAGDFEGAVATIRRYRTLRPADANPLDSEGDIQLMYGHLPEAEDLFVQADKKDRKLLGGGDLLKAAMARLMTGDVPGAGALYQQYAAVRGEQHDPTLPIQNAEWRWFSGNRKAAQDELRSFAQSMEAGPRKDLASRAYTVLSIWMLTAGDRSAAAQTSLKAATLAAPGNANEAVVARFLSQPSAAAAEWTARADQIFRNAPQSAVRNLTLAYALLLDRQFTAAEPLLAKVYGEPDSDPGLPILLAWSLVESGKPKEAAPLLRLNPVPQFNGFATFTPLYFPRLYDLRARVSDNAKANRELYEKLSR